MSFGRDIMRGFIGELLVVALIIALVGAGVGYVMARFFL
jgi:ABC-type antimicrobial peptide transport system permease subunit